MWCDTLSLSEWVSYVPARDGCTLLPGATVLRTPMCVLTLVFLLLKDTKCPLMAPLLSFSNSQRGPDDAARGGGFSPRSCLSLCELNITGESLGSVARRREPRKGKSFVFFWFVVLSLLYIMTIQNFTDKSQICLFMHLIITMTLPSMVQPVNQDLQHSYRCSLDHTIWAAGAGTFR